MNTAYSYMLAVSALICLSACSGINSVEIQSQAQIPERVFIRGIVKINADDEQDSISLCDSNEVYDIYLNDEVYQEAQTLSKLAESFYVEVYGQFASSAETTVFNVTQLNMMSTEINLCQHATKQSRAFGEEPFWSVALNDKYLEYAELGKKKQKFELLSQETSPNKRYYQANEAKLTLVQKICHDTMNDSVYGWQAKLTQDGKTLDGCAVVSSLEMNAVER